MVEANRDQPEDSRIVFRVGLHLGDLIVDGDDLYGNGGTIAERFKLLAVERMFDFDLTSTRPKVPRKASQSRPAPA